MSEITLTQEVKPAPVQANSFDLLLRFTNTVDQPELFMDELVKLVLEGLLEKYGQIVVKISWWSEDLTVIVPNALPIENALQGTQEAS